MNVLNFLIDLLAVSFKVVSYSQYLKLSLSSLGIYVYIKIFFTEKIVLSTDANKLRANSAKWRLFSD